MESLMFYLQETSVSNALNGLVTYCYDVMDGRKQRDDIDLVNEVMIQSKSALMKQLMQECTHKNAVDRTDYISNVWSSLIILKDTVFARMQLRTRAGIETGPLKTLYSGLQRIESKILRSWPAHCCKETVKVEEQNMYYVRQEMSRKMRDFKRRLKWHVLNAQLAALALQPVQLFLKQRDRSVLIPELERMQEYVTALENVVPEMPAYGAGMVTGNRSYVDSQLLPVLESSGYFTSTQLPQQKEDNEEGEAQAERLNPKQFRLLLKNTVGFFGALIRTFKETGYFLNSNMAETRRFFASCIQTTTTETTTEGALTDAYKNISEPTRKSLILFFKECIRWLESYKP